MIITISENGTREIHIGFLSNCLITKRIKPTQKDANSIEKKATPRRSGSGE